MLYKILFLLSGLVLLIINEKLSIRRLSKLLILPQMRNTPTSFPDNIYPEQTTYSVQTQNAIPLIFLKINPESIHKQIPILEQYQNSAANLILKPEMEQQNEALIQAFAQQIYIFIQKLRETHPQLRIIAYTDFLNTKSYFDQYWLKIILGNRAFFSGGIQMLVFPFEPEPQEDDNIFDLLQKSRKYSLAFQNFPYNANIPQHQVTPIHLLLKTHQKNTWGEALALLDCVIRTQRTSYLVSIAQQINPEEFNPVSLVIELFLSACRNKTFGDALVFNPTQMLEDVPVGMAAEAVLGQLFMRDWQQNIFLVNFSDYPIEIDLGDVFIKDFYLEQISAPSNKVFQKGLDKAYLKTQFGKKTGNVTLLPYSVSKLSSEYFIPLSLDKNILDIDLEIDLDQEHQRLNMSYFLPKAYRINVLIMNAFDEVKFRLDKQYQKAGTYELQFNISQLPSGKYTIVLISNKDIWQQVITI